MQDKFNHQMEGSDNERNQLPIEKKDQLNSLCKFAI